MSFWQSDNSCNYYAKLSKNCLYNNKSWVFLASMASLLEAAGILIALYWVEAVIVGKAK
jgi:hypothetical protein